MPRSHPTLDQRRSNSAFSDSRSGPSDGVRNDKHSRSAYANAAKRLWQLSDDWEVNLLMNVFGPDLMGSFAAAFDPLAKFRVGGQKVDVARRKRVLGTRSHEMGINSSTHEKEYRNFVINPDISTTIVGEYLYGENTTDTSYDWPVDISTRETFMEDSTDALRLDECRYSEMRSCVPGTMTWLPLPSPSTVYTVNYKETRQFVGGLYIRREYRTTFNYVGDGPIVPIVDNFGFKGRIDDLESNMRQWAAQHLEDVLPPCLTSFRKYNAFYQIGELKDLPMMIDKTFESLYFLRGLTSNPKAVAQRLDKTLSNAYLNKEFGWDSLIQALDQLKKAPKKIAKRMNYMLERNSKITTSRFTQKYSKEDPALMGWLSPGYNALAPQYCKYYFADDSYEFDPKGEIRCAINGIIDLPRLAVPKFSDSTFRDMLGLNPRITDLYNLFPWTWLGDWFSGVSKYLNLIETVALDETLVNVGFITAILDSSIHIKGKLRLWQNYDVTYNRFNHIISENMSDPIDIEYDTAGTMKYRTRFSIDELPGVKSVLDKQGLLSEKQKTILGALFTKFT